MKKIVLGTLVLVCLGVGGYSLGNSQNINNNTAKVQKVSYSYDKELYRYLQNELTKGESYYDCQYIMAAFDLNSQQTDAIENKILECYDKDSQFNKELRGAIDYWSSDGSVEEAAEKMKENQFPNNDNVTVKKLINILNYAKHN